MITILLVEDNEMNRDMLSRRLVRRGFKVEIATDGGQGVTMASTASPDLILMDMSLPVLDGWEATRRIKADPGTRHIPVIALSANVNPSVIRRGLDAGFLHYLAKPLDISLFLRVVVEMCSRPPA